MVGHEMGSTRVKFTLCIYLLHVAYGVQVENVSVLTVATENTHGLQRLQRSAKVNGFSVEVLGLDEKWTGGDMNLPGGGQKIKFLRNKLYELQKTKSKDHIVIFTDGYDVIYLDGIDNIINRFKEMADTRILFSAEPYCWPDWSLAKNYPTTAHNSPYLNSGLFMGYLNELYELVSNKPIKDTDDDQLYYTMAFIDENLRKNLKISLDYSSKIFQNLQGLTSDIELKANGSVEWPYIENKLTNERPLVVHGNGLTKLTLNNYGNYLAKAWSPVHGCKMCQEKKITLDEKKLPNVFLSIFIEQPTPFIEEFFNSVKELDYPKSKINLLIRNNVPYHEEMVEKFVADNRKTYSVVKRIKPEEQMTEAESRKVAMDRCVNGACDYFFSLDSVARVKPSTLKYLLSSGYDVISPMLLRPGHAWSNFWGAINANGFYARSHDYMDIVGSTVVKAHAGDNLARSTRIQISEFLVNN